MIDLFSNYRKISKKIISAALIVLTTPIGWSIKNYLIFSITAPTSWSGCALGQSVTAALPSNKEVDTNLQDD
ncbi:hypothetical protein KBZ14_09030 [Synechococcus sp. HJ21-Hayes]|uniref:hypothetical protein n=1 Tax=unclassified Synechococcus TaxID=2626047 RepID=UPI0020CBE090|nr:MULTISPECIES: hypothetical protein [unclassified Synechococcus]MCP9830266.1 hypothetical protein [Synechococcus sp. JJ3a-Johnson]MCP9853009.1 hypothetical protein [Synechococcus sp. HJ21-Hayes]